jgi:hypothetical protein
MNIEKAYTWYSARSAPEQPSNEISQSRDIFQARLLQMLEDLLRNDQQENHVALLSAVVGEIGNNCFDHNLGKWQDVPGCWFEYDIKTENVFIIIADRGQGVLSSLKRVAPQLKDDQTAIQTAFEKRISGRSPEKRGNGLKFVREAVHHHPSRGLVFLSGKGKVFFGGLSSELCKKMESHKTHADGGTFSLIQWKITYES